MTATAKKKSVAAVKSSGLEEWVYVPGPQIDLPVCNSKGDTYLLVKTAKKKSVAAVKSSGLEEWVSVPGPQIDLPVCNSKGDTYLLVEQDEVLIL